jgi:serine/threonine-protein kinase
VARSLNSIGRALRAQGEHERAAAAFRRSLAIRDKALGPEHVDVAAPLGNLGLTLIDLGRPGEARAQPQQARGGNRKRNRPHGPDGARTAAAEAHLGLALVAERRAADGLAHLRAALAIRERALAAADPAIGATRVDIARVLIELRRLDDARAELAAAEAQWDGPVAADDPRRARLLAARGLLELAADRPAAAVAPLERALALAPAAELRFALARALIATDRARALELARAAAAELADAPAGRAGERTAVATWLRRHGP